MTETPLSTLCDEIVEQLEKVYALVEEIPSIPPKPAYQWDFSKKIPQKQPEKTFLFQKKKTTSSSRIKTILIAGLLLFIGLVWFAKEQSKGPSTLRGRVSFENEGIQGAYVSIEGIGRSTETNLLGRFEFPNLKGGEYTLVVKADSFHDLRYPIFVKRGKQVFATIRLSKRGD